MCLGRHTIQCMSQGISLKNERKTQYLDHDLTVYVQCLVYLRHTTSLFAINSAALKQYYVIVDPSKLLTMPFTNFAFFFWHN